MRACVRACVHVCVRAGVRGTADSYGIVYTRTRIDKAEYPL